MKILAALKKIKHLDRKIEKQMQRTKKWCSFITDSDEFEPTYDWDDLDKMRQSIGDLATQKAAIRAALHLTNVRTKVQFQKRECSIDELLLFQNVVLPAKMAALTALRRREKNSGFGRNDNKDSWVEMQYNPKERDKEIEKLEAIKDELDELLDRINIETDVVGLAEETLD